MLTVTICVMLPLLIQLDRIPGGWNATVPVVRASGALSIDWRDSISSAELASLAVDGRSFDTGESLTSLLSLLALEPGETDVAPSRARDYVERFGPIWLCRQHYRPLGTCCTSHRALKPLPFTVFREVIRDIAVAVEVADRLNLGGKLGATARQFVDAWAMVPITRGSKARAADALAGWINYYWMPQQGVHLSVDVSGTLRPSLSATHLGQNAILVADLLHRISGQDSAWPPCRNWQECGEHLRPSRHRGRPPAYCSDCRGRGVPARDRQRAYLARERAGA